MKPELVIVSDMWGKKGALWIPYCTRVLSIYFSIRYIDCCVIGQVDTTRYTRENLHRQFVQGGIERGAKRLSTENLNNAHLLAFSVGGTIAWKACLKGAMPRSLTCVSSTRLRHETFIPTTKIQLIFSSNDAYRPTDEWYRKFSLDTPILMNGDHDVYQTRDGAEMITRQLIKTITIP